jgi:lipopolysaccharide/colanic/teichoic acid biosynthesis glycosyltransferase
MNRRGKGEMVSIQDFRCYSVKQIIKISCTEFLLFLLAFILSYILGSYLGFIDTGYTGSTIFIAIYYAGSLNICLYILGLYNKYMNLYLPEQFLRIISAVIIQFIILSNISYWIEGFDIGKPIWLYSLGISYVFLMISRTMFAVMTKSNALKSKTVVLGASNKALQLKNNIDNKLNPQTKIVGYIHKPGERERLSRENIIDISINNNNDNELLKYCLANNISTIVVAVDDRRSNFPLSHLLGCKQNGINVIELMDFYGHEFGKIELSILDPSWVIYSNNIHIDTQGELKKVIFDVVLATILLLVCSPLLLTVYILLKLNNGFKSRVISSEIKLGRFSKKYNHYQFNCYKNTDQLTFIGKIVTRLGVQLLPTLFNIIKGELSFIGPQPIDVDTDKELSKKFWYYKQRYASKPGLFAWGYDDINYSLLQDVDKVNAAEQQLQFDLFYYKNQNLLLDTLILLNKLLKIGTIKQVTKVNSNLNAALDKCSIAS